MTFKKYITFFAVSSAVLAASSVYASQQGASLTIDVSGRVDSSCEVRSISNFAELGAGIYRIGTIDRFCNTPYQLNLGHNARISGGSITIDSDTTPLQSGSFTVVPFGTPVNSVSDIIVSNVNFETAQSIAQSLSLQITPRSF